MRRCGWVSSDPLYVAYHDSEWGVPSTDERYLFEMICLEGQQAGLSWITVLKKRDRYRQVFDGFDFNLIARYGEPEIEERLRDPGIIRHRGKIEAIIANARAINAMHQKGETLSQLVWSHMDHTPQINHPATLSDVPAVTPVAGKIAQALKKRGFKFVGPTTCYAFMQACGLVNDHTTDCFCHPDNARR